LEALLDSSPDLVWVGFVSAEAKVVSATGGRRETESVSTQAWFNGARTQAFFGEPREVPELARDYPLAGETPRFVTISAPVTSAVRPVNIYSPLCGFVIGGPLEDARLRWRSLDRDRE
jgi:hypothetical protein